MLVGLSMAENVQARELIGYDATKMNEAAN
jgi:hypothetical protein